jgi:hypothetical protein
MKVSNKWWINAFNLSTSYSYFIFICLHHTRRFEFHSTHTSRFFFSKSPQLEMLTRVSKETILSNNIYENTYVYIYIHTRLFFMIIRKVLVFSNLERYSEKVFFVFLSTSWWWNICLVSVDILRYDAWLGENGI